MGMTIEESIDLLDNLVGFVEDNQGNDNDGALILAINIMRKYQKIQEVMDSRVDDDTKSNSKALSEIEVIMYGDND